MKFGLSETVIEKLHSVFKRYPQIEKAILYGSRAKGNYQNGSDIDLTLFGNQSLTHQTLLSLLNEIDDLYLPYTIDLSLADQINDSEILEHIARVGVTFYEAQLSACHKLKK